MAEREDEGAGSGGVVGDSERNPGAEETPPPSPSAGVLDVSAISLHIALDTPPPSAVKRGSPAGGEEECDRILQPEHLPTPPPPPPPPPASAQASAGAAGGEPGHAAPATGEARAPAGLVTDAEASARRWTDAGTPVLQTPQNAMRSPAALRRETWSSVSSSSTLSACLQLQTPARRQGDMAEVEQSLLSETGGAMLCLYSEDMAPLVSVAHGMQLPRAQIGLLGACFTSCRSNAFELYKVQAGGSTIAYRSHLGGRVLAVVVLSSWGGSSGSLLDRMLKRMHDNVWAAVCLVVGEQNVMQLLEANKVSQLRKALKSASVLLQHLLTGRAGLELLTGALAAIPHLTRANSAKACVALEHACRELAVPGPHSACILADGKLCVATASWCRLLCSCARSPASGPEVHGRQEPACDPLPPRSRQKGKEEEVQTDILLLHLLGKRTVGVAGGSGACAWS